MWHLNSTLRSLHIHSGKQAGQETDRLTATINKYLQYVSESIEQNGDTLSKRWRAKSADQRTSLLVEAMPHMCKKRWLPVELLFDTLRNLNHKVSNALAGSFSDTLNNLIKAQPKSV